MNFYTGTQAEDVLIAGWWHRMHEDGDLEKIFPPTSQTLSELFRLITPPKELMYEFDARGIWFAFWIERLLSGVAAGLWIRKDRRRSRASAWTFLEAADTVLRFVPVILGITKQRSIVRIHQSFGYTVVGEIPELYGGETGIVVALTRRGLLAARERLRKTNPEEPPSRSAMLKKIEERMGLRIPSEVAHG